MNVNAQMAFQAYAEASKIAQNSGAAQAPQALSDAGDFAELVQGAVNAVAEKGQKAETAAVDVAKGKGDLVDLVTTIAETEVAVESLVAVRDRVLTAYRDIMNMPI